MVENLHLYAEINKTSERCPVMVKKICDWMIYWATARQMYCRICKKETPFERSVWDGALVCQVCKRYRIKN